MTAVTTLLAEDRAFAAPAHVAATANFTAADYEIAAADPLAWWHRQAEFLQWHQPWHTVLDWRPAQALDPATPDGELSIPSAQWFGGGKLNAAVNCVDRHVAAGHGERVAYHFEGERGDRRSVTYAQLQREVAKAANALTQLGVKPGDRVVLYLPVIVETIVATLAIARIGAVHSLVFGGFSAEALRYRVADTEATVVITTDGQFRRGAAVGVKATVDEAVAGLDHVRHVLVIERTGAEAYPTDPIAWTPGRDLWWHDVVGAAPDVHEPQFFDAEHPLFIIYTSGTTGRPKGLVHTTGGYLTHAAYAQRAHFDAKPEPVGETGADVHWCTADLAWVTAHTFVLYGPLLTGITSVIYEGTPDTPHAGRHFEIIERYGVTTYYTAPTLIRTLMAWQAAGQLDLAAYDLGSIRLLGTVGEPTNPAAWTWFRDQIGAGRAPIIDTWWQSETGATIIAPLPGASAIKPGAAGRPLPGLSVRVVDDAGNDVPPGAGGNLVIDKPWPGMARTVWGDPQRYLDSYWAPFADRGYYLSGDGARIDAEGDVFLLGRIDEVVNVSGHRLSTTEIESALVAHPAVAEAGVAAVPHERTGQAVVAFVIAKARGQILDDAATDLLERELREHVAASIGPIARPLAVIVTADLPRTRSGKILRRVLGNLFTGQPPGDVTSLQDATSLDHIRRALRTRAARTPTTN